MAERLRTAIAKARAQRAAMMVPAMVPPPPPRPAPDPEAVARAWAALPDIAPVAAQLAHCHIVTGTGTGTDTGIDQDAAAPFDALGHRLLHEMRANGWSRVAITSPRPGCGRSTVAANLAFSLARRQADARIILFEMDMRAPWRTMMHRPPDAPQFPDMIAGNAALPRHLLRAGPNLCLAMNAPPPADPPGTDLAARTPAAIDTLEAMFAPTVLLLDLPPMLTAPETAALLGHADCALLVVAADDTQMDEAEACTQELSRHTRALGIVLNKLRQPA